MDAPHFRQKSQDIFKVAIWITMDSTARSRCCREMESTDGIIQLLVTRGSALYLGEAASQQEHALQTAKLAAINGASDSLIVAALLHDIAYMIGADTAPHEDEGSRWLSRYFGPEVTEPVRLHVAAKRYLCTVN